jgi:hypothetical protein
MNGTGRRLVVTLAGTEVGRWLMMRGGNPRWRDEERGVFMVSALGAAALVEFVQAVNDATGGLVDRATGVRVEFEHENHVVAW